MNNGLKLLMTEQDLHNLKNVSIELEKYKKEILEPFKATLSGEIRRYITIHRKIEVILRQSEIMSKMIDTALGGR